MPNENNADQNDNFDLGLDIESPSQNIFEQFHQSRKEAGNNEPVVIKKKETTTDENTDDDKDKDTESKATNDPKINTEGILEMARKQVLGLDQDDDNNDGQEDDNKSKSQTKTKLTPQTDQFQILHDHFVDQLGYEALSEEDLKDGITEAKFIEFQERNLQLKAQDEAEEMIAEAFANQKENEPLAKDFFRFLSNGGKIQDFLDTRTNDEFGNEYLSEIADDEDDVKIDRAEKVMRTYYKSIGWEDAAIDKTVKTLKTGGSLLDIAETTLPQFVKQREARKAIADQNAKQQKLQNEQAIKNYNTKLFEVIDSLSEFGQFTLTAKDRRDLKEYMYAATVTTQDGRKIPQYIADLEVARANPNFAIYQALNLKNKKIDLTGVKQKAANAEKSALHDKLVGAAKGNKLDQAASGSLKDTPRSTIKETLDFDNIQFV